MACCGGRREPAAVAEAGAGSSYGETALAIYQELAGAIPEPMRPPGADACAAATEWFSQKDYKNAMFYFRRRAYDSAIIYFKDVIATYPGTSRVPDALMRLVDSYASSLRRRAEGDLHASAPLLLAD